MGYIVIKFLLIIAIGYVGAMLGGLFFTGPDAQIFWGLLSAIAIAGALSTWGMPEKEPPPTSPTGDTSDPQ